MKDELFYRLWQDALSQPDKEIYVAEYGYPDWFDEISPDPAKAVETLERIHDAAWMPAKEIINRSGLTNPEFAAKMCIPLRTIQNWTCDSDSKRKCPDYIRLSWCRQLGILKEACDEQD